ERLDHAGRGARVLDPPYLDGADGDVGAAVHEVLLEVDPFAAVTCLDFDPRLHRIVGHRQNANPGDTQPIGQLSGDARWRPAGRKQLGAPQMCRQIHVAEAEPRFAIQPLERVHPAKRPAPRTPTARQVDRLARSARRSAERWRWRCSPTWLMSACRHAMVSRAPWRWSMRPPATLCCGQARSSLTIPATAT